MITFNQLPLYTDDFFWWNLVDYKDAIVIHNPQNALIISPVFLRSRRSLEEHIEYVRKNNVKKAIVVAEDISFLKSCPSLEYLMVLPAITANNFDYSPLYELKNIKWLMCETMYGEQEEKISCIDYSRFNGLRRLGVDGAEGHVNVQCAKNVETLFFDSGFPKAKTLEGIIPGKELRNFRICQSPIQSLDGIEAATKLRRLTLQYNRRLNDISALRNLQETLVYLEIEACGKIVDFSVLRELHKLEFLILKGSNTLEDLSFLKEIPNLKNFWLTMNVKDGDLGLCLQLPYARIQNRKHFSHKDNDMPKTNYINPEQAIPFEIV